jgi:hypothetical protein
MFTGGYFLYHQGDRQQFLQELHNAKIQKATNFILVAVRTLNLTNQELLSSVSCGLVCEQ